MRAGKALVEFIDQLQTQFITAVVIGALVIIAIIVLIVILTGIKVAKPDEAIIVTSRSRKSKIDPDGDFSSDYEDLDFVRVGGCE